MKLHRRSVLYGAAGAIALLVRSPIARAQAYPTRSVHLIVGFPAGFTPDIIARLTAQSLSERLGQQVIVDNRPGAASNIGTELVVRALPDGYTLLGATGANAINATLFENLNFNFMRDTMPVASVVRTPLVMTVNPSVPANTVSEFIAYAKSNPGKLNMASGGVGSTPHVAGELFKMAAGVNLVHVPYRINNMPDLLAGQVQMIFAPVPTVIGYIRAGRLRALAVTSTTRLQVLPNTPTLAEFVPGYEASTWFGLAAPKKTPLEIVDKLNNEVNACLSDPKLLAQFADLGSIPISMSPADFGKLIADEIDKWAKVIKTANIKPE
ncbi:MAG: tripartite tricarboxylate transporter substrate binding protein [Xanthobacteraceae bacterium]|jgi:tripartite-type tricarboxylate transporter receptor subunit TctC